MVVGLDSITGLQTARLLARRGVPVTGIASDPRHFCARTRVCEEVVRADTASEALTVTLEQIRTRFAAPPVIYPCTDNAVLRLSRDRARLVDGYRLALPDEEVVELLIDKASFDAHARAQGFNVPATVTVNSSADLDRAVAEVPTPCVLKPAFKDDRWLRHTSVKGFVAWSADELVRTYRQVADWNHTFIVQQWVEGPPSALYSCNCYFDRHGRPLVTFVSQKLRQWPPETGVGTLGVDCRNDAVRDETVRLFQDVRFHGLGYVEMKEHRLTGELFVIEANVGRPTGRSAIAEAGGVELHLAMYCDLVGLPLPPALEQRYTGVRWVYFRRDVQSALERRRAGELSVREWLSSLSRPRVEAVASLRDPLPFVADVGRAFALPLGRRVGSPRGRRVDPGQGAAMLDGAGTPGAGR